MTSGPSIAPAPTPAPRRPEIGPNPTPRTQNVAPATAPPPVAHPSLVLSTSAPIRIKPKQPSVFSQTPADNLTDKERLALFQQKVLRNQEAPRQNPATQQFSQQQPRQQLPQQQPRQQFPQQQPRQQFPQQQPRQQIPQQQQPVQQFQQQPRQQFPQQQQQHYYQL